jgi:carbon-monoxide dehydrogenase catalytic subunit
MKNFKENIDPSQTSLSKKARKSGIYTCFDRAENLFPCPIGRSGSCCSLCFMGPCRLTGKEGREKGVCGASLSTVASRNFTRIVAAGTAAHAAIARDLAFLLKLVGEGKVKGYEVKDGQKLKKLAKEFGIDHGKDEKTLASEVADFILEQFSNKESELPLLSRAPEKRQKRWQETGIAPRGIDWEVSEALNRTSLGTDQDYKNILLHSLRTALADGWGASMTATELFDILFGTPRPLISQVDLGVLKKDYVNIVVHGHYPLVAEALLKKTKDSGVLNYACEKGAKGINLVGLCCTASEVLMRQGVPAVGGFLQQEMAILSGLVDAMVVDMQCIFEALVEIARHYRTKVITTSPQAKIEGALHIEFTPQNSLEKAEEVIRLAVENFSRRKGKKSESFVKASLVSGFSHEYITYMLGGEYLASLRPLNEAIIDGRLPGVVAVVGCSNPRVSSDGHDYVVRELVRNNVLVLQTGCSALASAKSGLMVPEAKEEAGPILKVICKSVGIPPVLHVGSCVDNSRILTLLSQMVADEGLGEDISDLPVAGVCPEWMSEKSLSIGTYFAASGIYVLFGGESPVKASPEVTEFIGKGWGERVGGKIEFESDYELMVEKVLNHLRKKREALGLGPHKDREVHDIKRRRFLLWWRNQLRLWPKLQSRERKKL